MREVNIACAGDDECSSMWKEVGTGLPKSCVVFNLYLSIISIHYTVSLSVCFKSLLWNQFQMGYHRFKFSKWQVFSKMAGAVYWEKKPVF